MLKKLKYHGLQRVMNTLNQFNRATPEWGQSEELYNRIYLEHTTAEIDNHFGGGASLKVLDGGCGTGKMAVELAKQGHEITGIEIHKPSLDVARENAREARVSIEWISGDLHDSLKSMASESFDVVLCYGVLYTCTQYREIISEYSRLMRPGGLLFASFRSKFYFITSLLRQKQYEKALYVANNSEGALKLASVPSYYNWQTGAEVTDLYGKNDLEIVDLRPVGVFTGTGYDGMAAILDVEEIPADIVHSALYELETSDLGECLGASRFMLGTGKKRGGSGA